MRKIELALPQPGRAIAPATAPRAVLPSGQLHVSRRAFVVVAGYGGLVGALL